MSNMVVRTNTLALNSHRNLGLVGNNQARASSRLSSGFRINSGADDAAGLAISEGMRSQIRGMNQASRNAQDGISLIQTAEGYTGTMTELIQRARELATQGANDTNSSVQRGHIRNELGQIAAEANRIWTEGTFNGQVIFGASGMLTSGFELQIGADGTSGGGSLDIHAEIGTDKISDVNTTVTDTNTFVPGTANHAGFRTVMDNLEDALDEVSALRAGLGAVQNRLEFTIENLDIASENLSASESRIRDADMAAEMMRLTQANVLQQAATSMLAQANQAPQSVLQLLG
jgi:flagellin